MKKLVSALLFLLLAISAYSKTVPLAYSVNENGEIIVTNNKGIVEDRIHLENATDTAIKITIKGKYKKSEKTVIIATDFIASHDTKYLATSYEDDLDDFSFFIITIEGGKITSCQTESAYDDLYIYINETDLKPEQTKKTVSAYSAADELLKWKELLDKGVITQEEFDAKKKTLLGL